MFIVLKIVRGFYVTMQVEGNDTILVVIICFCFFLIWASCYY